jgi:hypothetical protein
MGFRARQSLAASTPTAESVSVRGVVVEGSVRVVAELAIRLGRFFRRVRWVVLSGLVRRSMRLLNRWLVDLSSRPHRPIPFWLLVTFSLHGVLPNGIALLAMPLIAEIESEVVHRAWVRERGRIVDADLQVVAA